MSAPAELGVSAVVVGAGAGLGAAVARAFASTGHRVTLIARHEALLRQVCTTLPAGSALGLTADAADPTQLHEALDASIRWSGVPRVLVYNAALVRADRPGELSVHDLVDTYRVNVLGALTATMHLAPRMKAAGGGSVLITGGMPTPVAAYTSLSLGKAAVRALTTILAAELAPANIHVATITVGGAIAAGSAFDPDEIATHYLRLHAQPRRDWESEHSVVNQLA